MKLLAFSTRNTKELLRDRLNLFFGIGFPLVLLLLLSLIQSNIPVSLFEIAELTPGIAVFGLSFISLFSGVLIAKDRAGAFMLRLLISPMRAHHFILGYTLPLLPLALAQTVVCYGMALLLGLPLQAQMLPAIAVTVPAAVFFIALGLLCGSLMNDKQIGGVCGALLTNLTAWLSGVWFDLALVGGAFERAAHCLPFFHAVQAGRLALRGDYASLTPHLVIVCAWALVFYLLAVFVFWKKMRA